MQEVRAGGCGTNGQRLHDSLGLMRVLDMTYQKTGQVNNPRQLIGELIQKKPPENSSSSESLELLVGNGKRWNGKWLKHAFVLCPSLVGRAGRICQKLLESSPTHSLQITYMDP